MRSIKLLFLALAVMLASTAWAPITAPSRPGLYSPINNAVLSIDVATDDVTLKWYKSSPSPITNPITDYDIEISEGSSVDLSGAFTSTIYIGTEPAPVPITSTVTHLVVAPAFDQAKTYYWHIRANDGVLSSSWSITGKFRVGVTPLAALAVTNLDWLRPTFTWTSGPENADSFTLQISTDSGFATINYSATIAFLASPPNQYIPAAPLAANMTYYWRVRANAATLGASAWTTAAATFTTANPPSIPVLVSPNSTQVGTQPTLIWKPVLAPASDPFAKYEIEIFDTNVNVDTIVPYFTITSPAEASLAIQGVAPGTRSYTVPLIANLLPATTYYWRVKAWNNNLVPAPEYSVSTLFKFYTTIVGKVDAATMDPSETLGNVPGLLGPVVATTKIITLDFSGTVAENINLLSLRPIFEWDPGAINAQTFTLQVAAQIPSSLNNCKPSDPNSSTFASTIINVSLPYSQHTYTANFENYRNTVLCWRIRGVHSLYGASDWSDVQVFLTANPPGIPILVSPVDLALTNDNSPEFKWAKVTMPSGPLFGKYEIEISHRKDFSGYTYAMVAPYPLIDPLLDYPLSAPTAPNDPIIPATDEAVLPFIDPIGIPLYTTNFPLYPQINQAHDPETEIANTIDEPWFQMHAEFTPAAPAVPDFGPLYGGTTYYWRVRSYNLAGEYSSWSLTRTLKIIVDRPENLTVDIPPVAPDVADLRPLFSFDPVIKAATGLGVRYRIEISRYPDFRGAKILTSTYFNVTTYRPAVDLPANMLLYARVFARDPAAEYGESLPSTPISFTTAFPPTKPILLLPKNNTAVATIDLVPTFKWSPSTIPAGSAAFDDYDIQIGEDPNFILGANPIYAVTATGISDTTYTVAVALDPIKKYYWRVRACNITPACSTWSTTFNFKSTVEAPTALIMDIAAPYTPLKPNFSWGAVTSATTYTLVISRYSTCYGTGITVGTNTYTRTANLAAGTTYYWCVRANSAFGPSAWSWQIDPLNPAPPSPFNINLAETFTTP